VQGEEGGSISTQDYRDSTVGSWILFLVGTAVLIFVLAGAGAIVCDPIGLGGNCAPWVPNASLATSSLIESFPRGVDASGTFIGLDKFTASALNHGLYDRKVQSAGVRYVDAQNPSEDPSVISVNPIDRLHWAAAARSGENGRCYTILAVADPSNPGVYGTTKYGVLPPNSPCVGSSANVSTTTLEGWPLIHSRQEPWSTIGVVVAVLALGIVIASKVLKKRVTNWQRRFLYWGGIVLALWGLMTFFATTA
jgi:hypothetical protein